ncbi:MAG TPA: adenylate cyclase [Dehalococcoidia bacterium]|nr:adenylate cyclase [Dehalococcoidia bacterium]
MTATTERPGLAGDQLVELMALMRGSDSVELKLTVPEVQQRSTIASLGIDPLEAQIRQVFFLDTPDLRLNAAGLVVRLRRVQGKRADSVVKLRPVIPTELPDDLRRSPDFRVEVDAMPGGFVCSASMKGVTENQQVLDTVAGIVPARRTFDKEQRRFFEAYAPDGLKLDDLSFLGPIFVLKAKWSPGDGLPRMVAEVWLYPDGSRVLELSTKCLPGDAFQVAAEARAFLHERGIDITGEQQTKTKQALSFFASPTPASTPPDRV